MSVLKEALQKRIAKKREAELDISSMGSFVQLTKVATDSADWHFLDVGDVKVAQASTRPFMNGLILENFEVDPDFRGEGYGKVFLHNVTKKLASEELYLKAEPYNNSPFKTAELKDFYRKFGFKDIKMQDYMVKHKQS